MPLNCTSSKVGVEGDLAEELGPFKNILDLPPSGYYRLIIPLMTELAAFVVAS